MRKLKNFNIRLSMDDLNNDKRNERLLGMHSLYTQATSAFVFLLVVYSFLLKYDIVGPSGYVRNALFKDFEMINDAYNLIFENVILAALFFILLLLFRGHNQKKWIRDNKNIWIKGLWLHIHIKNDASIRVGSVKITQSFDNINAEARNYDAKNITDPAKVTTWKYYSAQIDSDQLRGFYHSVRADHSTNSGMHCLDVFGNIYGYPVMLRGHFGDNYVLDSAKLSDLNEHRQHSGTLVLYRMTREQEKFLVVDGDITPERLWEMIQDSRFANDEFVKGYANAMKDPIKK